MVRPNQGLGAKKAAFRLTRELADHQPHRQYAWQPAVYDPPAVDPHAEDKSTKPVFGKDRP